MLSIEKKSATSGGNCASCSERWRKFEQCIMVVNVRTGKGVRGERYCVHCESAARNNNVIGSDDEVDAIQAAEMKREAWAGYQAAGCTEHFWTDQDAGLV